MLLQGFPGLASLSDELLLLCFYAFSGFIAKTGQDKGL